jgi:hypothetical protein
MEILSMENDGVTIVKQSSICRRQTICNANSTLGERLAADSSSKIVGLEEIRPIKNNYFNVTRLQLQRCCR